jgi:hypothetical protein
MSTTVPLRVEDVRQVIDRFRGSVADFVSHGCVFELRNYRRRVAFELPDLILAGILAGENILLTGSSGTGKTFLAQRSMRGLFGDGGFGLLNVTPGLDEDVLSTSTCPFSSRAGGWRNPSTPARCWPAGAWWWTTCTGPTPSSATSCWPSSAPSRPSAGSRPRAERPSRSGGRTRTIRPAAGSR